MTNLICLSISISLPIETAFPLPIILSTIAQTTWGCIVHKGIEFFEKVLEESLFLWLIFVGHGKCAQTAMWECFCVAGRECDDVVKRGCHNSESECSDGVLHCCGLVFDVFFWFSRHWWIVNCFACNSFFVEHRVIDQSYVEMIIYHCLSAAEPEHINRLELHCNCRSHAHDYFVDRLPTADCAFQADVPYSSHVAVFFLHFTLRKWRGGDF